MLAKDIIKLLDAGYSKEDIEKMESAENGTTNESAQEETNEEPAQEETSEEPSKESETPDPLSAYKEQLAEINKELAEATKEMQKYNLAVRRQPEAPQEDASDMLFNIIANVPPESNQEKEK